MCEEYLRNLPKNGEDASAKLDDVLERVRQVEGAVAAAGAVQRALKAPLLE